jgi:hypothetical protein
MPVSKKVRKNVLRIDATIAAGQRRIERTFGLPPGSVKLVLRSGRKARFDANVGALLRNWDWP